MTVLLFALIAAFLLPSTHGHAEECSEGSARETVEDFMEAAGAEDCDVRLTRLGAGPWWLDECRRQQGSPDAHMQAELATRTEVSFQKVLERDGRMLVVMTLHGPDPVVYQHAVAREHHCRPGTEANGLWGSFMSEFESKSGIHRTGCGEQFWAGIPVIERLGAVPVECRAGRWQVLDLP
ncbi:hypothetical protein [Marilutibacter chinensis]|uniref:Uncharacterized protein n=1 Tax=Marilutibacter chinensis TaxID=2912247 RepID=A0ABS9HYL1_9GAMM|nr:hypothetical protein [Lysobacter chinensis]MCF7223262.1 hypothetical protein [Lysobacter chinensis]